MSTSSPDLPPNQMSLQIKQDDKFFARLLSKESSSSMAASTPSFRVYYGGVAGAVPFMWESQPGTPKNTIFNDTTLLPPLTPPPSYYNSNKKPINKRQSSSTTSNLLQSFLFLKTKVVKSSTNSNVSPLSSSSSSSLSSSSSTLSSWSFSNPSMFDPMKKKIRFSTPGSSFDSSTGDDHHHEDGEASNDNIGTPTSTLCFSIRGCYGGW